MRERLIYILKHNHNIQAIYKVVMSAFFRFIGIFLQMDEKLILFSSFAGKKYNDSPKVLFERMMKDKSFSDYKMVWAFEHPENFSIPGAVSIKIDSWEYFKTALKAKIWITSVNIERGLHFKKKETIYINTWHGAGTKKIGNACAGRKDYNLSNVNMMLVQSDFEKSIFINDFNCLPDCVCKIGFPRNDELFHITETDKSKYRQQFNIPKNKKVILYAPTWRDSRDGGLSYKVEPPINIKKWRQALSNEFIVLFRMHPFTTLFDMHYDEFARDVSNYENLNHILAITDVLITDYSTIVYDSAVARIPFICFGFDYDHYKNERGFYFNLKEVYPGGVCYNEDDVLKRIQALMINVDNVKYEEFRNKYIQAGGNATEIIISKLKDRLLLCNPI